jgi:hypothetical protein
VCNSKSTLIASDSRVHRGPSELCPTTLISFSDCYRRSLWRNWIQRLRGCSLASIVADFCLIIHTGASLRSPVTTSVHAVTPTCKTATTRPRHRKQDRPFLLWLLVIRILPLPRTGRHQALVDRLDSPTDHAQDAGRVAPERYAMFTPSDALC